MAGGRARRRTARLHPRAPRPAGRRGAGDGAPHRAGPRPPDRDRSTGRRLRTPAPADSRSRVRGAHVRAPASRHRPGADRRRRGALLHHHPLTRPRRRRPRLRDPLPARVPRPRRPGRRPRRAVRLQRRRRRLRRRRRGRGLRRRHPPAARPRRPARTAGRPHAARRAGRRALVHPAHPVHPRKGVHAARAPARTRVLLLRRRGGRLAAPGPLGRRTGGADRGARGSHPERGRALRRVAAGGVPAERRVPAALQGRAGHLRGPHRPRRRHRHRDRPRRGPLRRGRRGTDPTRDRSWSRWPAPAPPSGC